MNAWHLTRDAPRVPRQPIAGEQIRVEVGTWPIGPGQQVWVEWHCEGAVRSEGSTEAAWRCNRGPNSAWVARIGPFLRGDRVRYHVRARSPEGVVDAGHSEFVVGPRVHVALLWHHHRPLLRDPETGRYCAPWVRLHALRDYVGLASLAETHGVRTTVALSPVLIEQIEAYAHGATDRLLELTRAPTSSLTGEEATELLAWAFDADWHGQIFPHRRYRELFEQRACGSPMAEADLRDAAVWSTLSWFSHEMRSRAVRLPSGHEVTVHRLVARERGYTDEDVASMLRDHDEVLRAVLPLLRSLASRGLVELASTPYDHPILPLLYDTDRALLDRPGAHKPPRFAHPEDATAHVRRAIEAHTRWFGRAPDGMWPAEGAVSPEVLPALSAARWIATDAEVLGRSGVDVSDPHDATRPWRADDVAVFFADRALSDALTSELPALSNPREAASEWVERVRERFARRLHADGPSVLLVAVDGAAWGGHRDDGIPFLDALYVALGSDEEIDTTTPARWMDGDGDVPPHPLEALKRVRLAPGSWRDEPGSASGSDHGSWIGEPEENRAWALMGEARTRLGPTSPEAAWRALYAAQASDWLGAYGGRRARGDELLDATFRAHLAAVWTGAGAPAPASLSRPLHERVAVWTFAVPLWDVSPGWRVAVRTNCPGRLTWRFDDGTERTEVLEPAPPAWARRYQALLPPIPRTASALSFRFRCGAEPCAGGPCCRGDIQRIPVRAGEGR